MQQIIKYAAENGNHAAKRKFGVNEKLVRDWWKAEVTLTAMKRIEKRLIVGQNLNGQS